MRKPHLTISREWEREYAEEMLRVGIVPSDELPAIGTVTLLGDQPIMVTGYATRDEFLQAVASAGLSDPAFQNCPENLNFIRISTD